MSTLLETPLLLKQFTECYLQSHRLRVKLSVVQTRHANQTSPVPSAIVAKKR